MSLSRRESLQTLTWVLWYIAIFAGICTLLWLFGISLGPSW